MTLDPIAEMMDLGKQARAIEQEARALIVQGNAKMHEAERLRQKAARLMERLSHEAETRRARSAQQQTERQGAIAEVGETVTIERFSVLFGLGKTSIYGMLKSGALRSVRIMGRRLIIVDSYRELLRQAEAAE